MADYTPVTPATTNKLADLWDRFTKAQVPLGSYEYGLGVDVNDILKPLTDTRGSDRMLPETVSLEDVGHLISLLPHMFDVRTMAEGQVKAQHTPADPDEAYGSIKRLLALFPMWGAEAGGAVAPATEAGSTTLGTYAGRKAATADKKMLAQAKKMEKAGASVGPSGETRQATGWFKDEANDWKFEIPDQGMRLREPKEFLTEDRRDNMSLWGDAAGVRLGDLVEHPALFGAYPEMANYGVTLDPRTGPDTASFSPADKIIHMGIIADKWAAADPRVKFAPQHRLSALHEMQHGVQHIEGFSQGGNPSLIARHKAGVMDEIDATRAEYNRRRGQGVAMEEPEMLALKERLADMSDRLSKFPNDDYKGYQRLLGETEARDVEARADLDHQERRMSTPYASQGIRPEDLIIRKTGAGVDEADISLSLPEPPPEVPPLSEAVPQPTEAPVVRRNLFDHSQLHQVPDVPQTDLPRYDPPRGPSERVQRLDDPKLIRKVNKYVDQGVGEGGKDWYNAEPLRKAFIDQLGVEEGQKYFTTYMDLVAATSPRSKVPANIRNASYYYSLLKNGMPLPDAPPLPQPYGHLAQNLHIQNAQTVAGPGWDPLKNPKPPSFGQNLMGNQRPVTVDTHNIRGWGILSGDPEWIALVAEDGIRRPRDLVASGTKVKDLEPTDYVSLPNKNEYKSLETMQQRLAAKKGLSPAQFQAALWVGARQITGMASPPVSFIELFERQVEFTAQQRGLSTTETLRRFIEGEQPLLSLSGVPKAQHGDDEKAPPLPLEHLLGVL